MKKLRIKVLERVIRHTITGETDRAERLMSKLMTAMGSQLVNEANYGDLSDPMFPARRELQRELEDDIDQDRLKYDDTSVDNGPDAGLDGGEVAGDMEGPCDGEGACSASEVAKMIQDLIAAGGLDEDKLAQIVDIIVSDEQPLDSPEGELEPDGELDGEVEGGEQDPAALPDDLEDPTGDGNSESNPMDNIKI